MCKILLPLKLLVDADAWQIGEQNKTYILYFLPPCSKNVSAPLIEHMRLIFAQNLRTIPVSAEESSFKL